MQSRTPDHGLRPTFRQFLFSKSSPPSDSRSVFLCKFWMSTSNCWILCIFNLTLNWNKQFKRTHLLPKMLMNTTRWVLQLLTPPQREPPSSPPSVTKINSQNQWLNEWMTLNFEKTPPKFSSLPRKKDAGKGRRPGFLFGSRSFFRGSHLKWLSGLAHPHISSSVPVSWWAAIRSSFSWSLGYLRLSGCFQK